MIWLIVKAACLLFALLMAFGLGVMVGRNS